MNDALDLAQTADALLRTMLMVFPGSWAGSGKTECGIHRSLRSTHAGSSHG